MSQDGLRRQDPPQAALDSSLNPASEHRPPGPKDNATALH
eukprot:CAMPEP_0170611074 /NCGR_PEP_ID=MMETSP0224-20130122/22997_1 /TAXON_ID=285029 /ORGANISM="Togula jolla, Strain CCCM 725" /LENGTH=39 /DNA_ID= /DNA_START= /DNA_END= /DNA_ORIENTATION=